MKILILSQYYPPETGACANRISGFARHLVNFGHDVTVVTGFPNYPSCEIYDGYKRKWCQKDRDGRVKLYRTWLAIGYPSRASKRFLNYLTFFVSSLWNTFFRVRKHDIVIATSGPILVGFAGAMLSAIWRKPFVLDLRDAWPERIVAAGEFKNPIAIKILEWIEAYMYRRASKIICVTQGLRIRLASRGVESSKLALVTNGSDTDIFTPGSLNGHILNKHGISRDAFVVIYAGTLGLFQDHSLIVETAKKLRQYEDIHLVMVGDGVRRKFLQDEKKAGELRNLHLIDTLSRHELAELLGSAKVGINANTNIHHNGMAIPVKMFDYMASELPFVVANEGEVETIAEESEAGFCTKPGDLEAFSGAILKLYKNKKLAKKMGARGRKVVMSQYSHFQLSKQLEGILSEVLREKDPKRGE